MQSPRQTALKSPSLPSVSESPSPRRISTWIWVFMGVSILAASFAGTSMLWPPCADGGDTAPANGPSEIAVCFGHVDVENGVIPLAPAVSGRVVEVPVNEGDFVRKKGLFGTPGVLFRLDSTQAELLVVQAEGDWLIAQAALEQAEKLPEQHVAQQKQQQAAIAAAASELARADALLEKAERLHKIGQAPEEDLTAAKELRKKAVEAKVAEEAKLDELKLRLPDAGVRTARYNVKVKKARLEQAQQALDECTVKVPMDGTILRRLVNVGDLIPAQPQQPSIIFCPNTPRVVRAEIEQEFAARVALGQTASIQDDTRTSGTWRGKVTRIADWYATKRPSLPEPKQLNDVRTLECIIELEPGQAPLKIGQRVRVTLIKY